MPSVQINVNIPREFMSKRKFLCQQVKTNRSDIAQLLGTVLSRTLKKLVMGKRRVRKQRALARQVQNLGNPITKDCIKNNEVLAPDSYNANEVNVVDVSLEPVCIWKQTSLPLCAADFNTQSVWYGCKKCRRVFSARAERDEHYKNHKERNINDLNGVTFPKLSENKSSDGVHVEKGAQVPVTDSMKSQESELPHLITPVADASPSSTAATQDRDTIFRQYDKTQLHCNICFRPFSSRKDLKIHVAGHNAAKPEKSIHLGRKTGNNAALSGYLLDPDDDTPFDDCDMPFLTKLFACKVCGKAFGLEYSLTRHMKTHVDAPERLISPFFKSHRGKSTVEGAGSRSMYSAGTKDSIEHLMRMKKYNRSSPTPMSP